MDLGIAAEAATVVVAVPTAVAGAVWLRRKWKRVEQFLGDWNGEAPRPGVPCRPGVMPRLASIEDEAKATRERVEAIERELHPNSGHTVKDQLNRVEEALGTGGPPD